MASLEGWHSATELRPPPIADCEMRIADCPADARHYTAMPFNPQSAILNPQYKGWWSGEDSNLRRRSQQIYSLPPLTAREPDHSNGSFKFQVQSFKLTAARAPFNLKLET